MVLRAHALRETVTNCFEVLLRKDALDPDHLRHLQAYLMMIVVLHLLRLPVINVLCLLLIAFSRTSLNIFVKVTDTTCCTVRLDTLALTSTNGRACTPRRRVTGTTSALTSTMGRA